MLDLTVGVGLTVEDMSDQLCEFPGHPNYALLGVHQSRHLTVPRLLRQNRAPVGTFNTQHSPTSSTIHNCCSLPL